MAQKLEILGESTVKRALLRYYNKKYENHPEKERESKIASALRKTLPVLGSNILSSTTKLGYAPHTNLNSLDYKSVQDFIDKSGYLLIYDSFSEGLEPVYFWILDYMKDNFWGTGLDVNKVLDEFQASVGSGFFGDMGTRASIMQDRAMKMMTTVNAVVRSIINILYDLKEFDQRLIHYNKLSLKDPIEKKNARLALKQIWMDRVDMQRGRGSINMLAQQLQFITLRDAFMAADSEEDVWGKSGKSGMDLNDRVKRILGPRVQEYLAWEKLSGTELKRRREIEKSYLKSQVESLKLYSQWARPYLKAAQQLSMADYRTPDLVSVFNNLQIQVTLFGKKSIGPSNIYSTPAPFVKSKFADIKLPKKMFACVEVSMQFRSIPHSVTRTEGGIHYTQGGRVTAKFRGFGLDEDEVKAVEDQETYDGLELIQGMTEESIGQMQEEIQKYIDEDKKEPAKFEDKEKYFIEALNNEKDPKRAKELEKKINEIRKIQQRVSQEKLNPFKAIFDGINEVTGPLSNFFKRQPPMELIMDLTKKAAREAAAKSAYQIYLVYKKAHGMVTE